MENICCKRGLYLILCIKRNSIGIITCYCYCLFQLEANEQLNPQGCDQSTDAENDSTHEALFFPDKAASPFELPPFTPFPEESSTNVPP